MVSREEQASVGGEKKVVVSINQMEAAIRCELREQLPFFENGDLCIPESQLERIVSGIIGLVLQASLNG